MHSTDEKHMPVRRKLDDKPLSCVLHPEVNAGQVIFKGESGLVRQMLSQQICDFDLV